jgi:hypothetical protein
MSDLLLFFSAVDFFAFALGFDVLSAIFFIYLLIFKIIANSSFLSKCHSFFT